MGRGKLVSPQARTQTEARLRKTPFIWTNMEMVTYLGVIMDGDVSRCNGLKKKTENEEEHTVRFGTGNDYSDNYWFPPSCYKIRGSNCITIVKKRVKDSLVKRTFLKEKWQHRIVSKFQRYKIART